MSVIKDYEGSFKIAYLYRANVSFKSGEDEFTAGEILVYLGQQYSHYDECFVHSFYASDKSLKSWWLRDNAPPETWKRFFEELGPLPHLTLFQTHALYRVRAAMRCGASYFEEGEVLKFSSIEFSGRNRNFTYWFRNDKDVEAKQWWLGLDEAPETARDIFEAVDNAAAFRP